MPHSLAEDKFYEYTIIAIKVNAKKQHAFRAGRCVHHQHYALAWTCTPPLCTPLTRARSPIGILEWFGNIRYD